MVKMLLDQRQNYCSQEQKNKVVRWSCHRKGKSGGKMGHELQLPGRLKGRIREPAPWIAGSTESLQVQEGSKAKKPTLANCASEAA